MTWLALWLFVGLIQVVNYWCEDQQGGGWYSDLGRLMIHWLLWPVGIGASIYLALRARRTYAEFRTRLGPDWRKRLDRMDSRELEFISKAVGEPELDPIYRATQSTKTNRPKSR